MIKTKTKLVKSNFSLTMKQEQKSLIEYIMDELKGVDISNLKLDPSFLKYIADIIENQISSKKHTDEVKPSKLDIFIEILKKLFPTITKEEISASVGIVEFLLKNELVTKIPLSKIMQFYLKKKFLSLT